MTYTYYAFRLTDGQVLAELPLVGARPSWSISGAGDLGSPTIRLDGLTPLIRGFVREATVPWRCGVAVDRDSRVVWSGVITGRQYSARRYTLTVPGLLAYWSRRYLTTNLEFKGVDQFDILKALFDHGPGPTVPLTHDYSPSGVVRQRYIAASQLTSVVDEVNQIADNINGYEYVLESAWDETSGTQRVTHRLRAASPILTSGRSGVLPMTVEWPGNASTYTWAEDGNEFAAEVWGSSQTDEGVDMVRHALNNTLLVAGYPRVQSVRQWSNISDPATLDEHVQQALAEAAVYGNDPTVTVQDAGDTAVGTWSVGDAVRLRITDQYRFPTSGDEQLQPGLDTVLRLREATVDPTSGKIDMTLTSRVTAVASDG